MTDQLKVTAILPCYNHKPFLYERIRSILCQTLPVSQIIFLDDASTDGSPQFAQQLLKEFSGELDIAINSSTSGSPFAQWNSGVRLAKHDLLWIAETDDSCADNFLETVVPAFDDRNTVISFTQSRHVDDNGLRIFSHLYYTEDLWPGHFQHDFKMSGSSFLANYLSYINVIPNASGVLFKRNAWLRAGQANQTLKYCGDWDLWIRVAALGDISFCSEELNYFRRHQATTRAEGNHSRVRAEFLACRLRAYKTSHYNLDPTRLYSHSPGLRVTPMDILDARERLTHPPDIRPVDLCSSRLFLRSFDDVPEVPALSWLMLAILSCLHALTRFFKRTASGILRRLRSF